MQRIFSGVILLMALAAGAADPGPASGGGFNRTYDDGYVLVRIGGNFGGFTWYWGYDRAEQVVGDTLQFHVTTTTSNVLTVLTDTYQLGGVIPPPPPYAGTEFGPGPQIEDAPVRTITSFTVPTLKVALSNAHVLLTWDGLTNAVAESTDNLSNAPSTNIWTTVTNPVVVTGNRAQSILQPTAARRFFRLRFP